MDRVSSVKLVGLESCKGGWYGKDCRQPCVGHCRDGITCNHVTGQCDKGCDAGWTGVLCIKACANGTFGYNCTKNCSGHCLNHSSCNKQTGHCDNGCNPGYTNDGCNKKCSPLNYGENCQYPCNVYCINKTCDRINGSCLYDCKGSEQCDTEYKTKFQTAMDDLPLIVGGIIGTFVLVIIGVVLAFFVIRLKRKSTTMAKRQSFILESKSIRANKPRTEQSKLQDRRLHTLRADDAGESTYALPEKTKRGPPTNKNIPVGNMKAQITNMCLNENSGFKSEYQNKCAQYWPNVNDKLQGGFLTIRHLEEKTYAEYIIRRFKIQNKSTRTDRQVTMFHYTTWSDHGVADPLSLVVFHRHVIRATANSAGKYTVVHCSAGVGRTGTYIALDALYQEGKRTGKINVPMYVRTMRKDRMNMIQGDDQYKLLYLALKDAFYGQNKCLESEKFLGEYQEQTCYTNCGDISQKKSLSSELEELLSLKKEYTQQDYISGRAQISANYTESVLPVEEFMCHLYYMKGYNTYYNAVLIQSYLEKESLISAQYPLLDNTEDFLRLIKDFDARVVVFLCPLKDIESTSKWFPPENQHKFDGIFYVKNMSSKRSNNVKMTRLNIQPTGFNEMDITLLECPTWGERLKKGDKRILLDVVKAVKTEKSDQKGRVLVLSRDGATRCGPFFVVYNVLEQISVDREVDIFTAVRQIQIRRPECVATVEEYQLCHDAIAEFLLNDCVYGNC
uniref:Receptor-type tyrosine-protein phosphatase T n=1 Tax=Magallana gigas TaxID=29159 RepID=A0A8W8NR64_MAGGI